MSDTENQKTCVVCGVPVDGFDYAWMVNNTVWAEAKLARSDRCHLGCLTERLGRELTIEDFPEFPINNILRYGFRMGQRETRQAWLKKHGGT